MSKGYECVKSILFYFIFCKKLENIVSGTCRSYVSSRYKCAETGHEKVAEGEDRGNIPLNNF